MSVSIDLDGFEMGEGTSYEVKPEGIEGLLGSPTVRTTDAPRGHQDGDVAGYDHYDARLVTIPVSVMGDANSPDVAADCLRKLEELVEAWEIVDNLDLLQLRVILWGRSYVLAGRPREVQEDDRSNLKSGLVEVTCVFYAPSPQAVTTS